MGPNAELEFRNWVPNCRNEIAIGFVEIGLTLKRGKGPDLPTPDPACGPHPVCTGPSLKKIEAISEFQAISERSSAPLSATERKRKLGLDRKRSAASISAGRRSTARHQASGMGALRIARGINGLRRLTRTSIT
jgi:hypothetical protein